MGGGQQIRQRILALSLSLSFSVLESVGTAGLLKRHAWTLRFLSDRNMKEEEDNFLPLRGAWKRRFAAQNCEQNFLAKHHMNDSFMILFLEKLRSEVCFLFRIYETGKSCDHR